MQEEQDAESNGSVLLKRVCLRRNGLQNQAFALKTRAARVSMSPS
jgi:hypothetical protein